MIGLRILHSAAQNRPMLVIRRRDHSRRMARFYRLALQHVLALGEPAQQELPECPRHPDLRCPGECQYILPNRACIYDQPPPIDLVREWGRIGSPGTVRASRHATAAAAKEAAAAIERAKRRKGYA